MYNNKSIQLLGGLVIASFVLLAQVSAMKMVELKCLDSKMDMKHMFHGFMECAGEMMSKEDVELMKNPDTPLEKKKEVGKKAHDNMCIRVCQWKKHQHMLTDDGKLNEAKMGEMVDQVVPEAARADIKSGMVKCYADHSQALDDKNNCEAYKPFQECMKKIYMDTCKIDHMELDQMMQ